MKIGIDIDNVLAELSDALHLWHEEKYNYSKTTQERTQFGLAFSWNCSQEEATKRLLEFYQSKEFKETTPVKGAIKAIDKLAKEHELHAITARPVHIEEETLKWIDKHFSLKNFKKIHINGQCINKEVVKTKTDICQELGIKLMIEDALHFADDCAEKGIKVLLLDWPWNQKDKLHSNITRVKDWDEILEIIDSTKSL